MIGDLGFSNIHQSMKDIFCITEMRINYAKIMVVETSRYIRSLQKIKIELSGNSDTINKYDEQTIAHQKVNVSMIYEEKNFLKFYSQDELFTNVIDSLLENQLKHRFEAINDYQVKQKLDIRLRIIILNDEISEVLRDVGIAPEHPYNQSYMIMLARLEKNDALLKELIGKFNDKYLSLNL